MEERVLRNFLSSVTKTGKYIVGFKEAVKAVKGSNVLITSGSLEASSYSKLAEQCKSHSVPLVTFDENSKSLGRALGVPFRVSVVAIKASGEADLASFLANVGTKLER